MDALAERLGVGGRQLRRLFLSHAGATPVAVAQTRRVLFAKQLLHETSLPMTDVALASGFGSVRRFNEVFLSLFGRPPTALRRQASPHTALTLSLGYRPPYDWPALLGFLAARAIPGVEEVTGSAYRRTIEVGGAAGTIAVSHDPARCRLRATIQLSGLAALPIVIGRLRRVFDLAADPAAIGAALSRDDRLRPLVAARPGLRVPGAWDGFELGVRAIVGQQVSVAAATRLAGQIAQAFGARLATPLGGLTHAFPSPERLAGATITGMPTARARAITTLASAAAADPRLFERAATLAGSVARLRALPGIGEWTAQYIAMRALREPDAFPAADIGLMRAMDDGAGRPCAAELLARAEAWRPWRAYAALHLWTGGPRPASSTTGTADALAA